MKKLLVSLMLACSFQLMGATYYASPTGSDTTGDGSIGNPWQTVGHSVRHGFPSVDLQAGDTLYLRGGLYTGNGNEIDLPDGKGTNGTPGNPITIKAYNNEIPIINGILGSSFIYYPVILKLKQYWVFDGITWSNNYGGFYLESVTNCIITNCVIGYMPTNGVAMNPPSVAAYSSFSLFGSSQLNKIQGNVFPKWGMISSNDALQNYKMEGSPLVLGNETSDDQTWYNLIEGNLFYHGGHDGMEIVSGYNVIKDNYFHQEEWIPTNAFAFRLYNATAERTENNPYGAWGSRIMKPGDAGDLQIDQRNVFQGNRMHYAGTPPDSGGAFPLELATQFSIYRQNTIAYGRAAGIYLNTSGMTTQIRSNTIYNNVIFSCGLSHVYGGTWMSNYSYGISMNTFENRMSTNFLVNNIVWGNHPMDIDPTNYVYQIMRTNWSGDFSLTDPAFVNTNGYGDYTNQLLPNFRLETNSPCIDTGTWLAFCTNTSSGNTIPLDNSLYFSDGNRIIEGDIIQLQYNTNRAIILSNDWQRSTIYLDRSLYWTNGQGVSLAYSGNAPDFGAFESGYTNNGAPDITYPITTPSIFRLLQLMRK